MQAYTSRTEDYLKELRNHSRAAISAFDALEHAESLLSLRLCLQRFLKESGDVSKVLWSRSNKKSGEYLRAVLYIKNNSPFSPAAFSGMKTALKEIENIPEGKTKEAVPQDKRIEGNSLEESASLQEQAAFSYDSRTKTLVANENKYEIMPLFLALRDLYASLPFFDELEACTEMLEKDQKNATALFQKALLLYKARRFEAALQLIEQVFKIVPDDFRVWYNRGVILSEMGRLDEAVNAYNRVIELEPTFEIAWDNKGVVLSRLGRFEEALEAYEKVLLRNPKYAEAWAGKGSVLSALDRKEEAIEAYRSALKIRPDYLEALRAVGNLFSRLDRFEEALEAYNKALQAEPEDPGLWAGRGLVLSELNKQEEALQSCNRALELKSGFTPALEIKVEILSRISRQKARDSQ